MPTYLGGEIEAKSQSTSYIYLLCAGALSENGVSVKGFTPDAKASFVLDMLKHMGADVNITKECVSVKKNILFGGLFNIAHAPELFPLVCVMAGLGDKMFTQITGLRNVRKQNADKVMVITENLAKVGIALSEDDDDEVIVWADNEIIGGSVDAHNDAHFVMALMILSGACNMALDIYEIDGLMEEYPDFIDAFNSLGGKAELLD